MPISIAVVICTWNRSALLAETLDSLASVEQPDGCAVDVIVVDNNSTDETQSVVATAARQWRLGTLQYLFEPRQGKQFALNRGIAATTAALVVFTDDDVAFEPQWLKEIVRAREMSGADVIGGITEILSPRGFPEWYAPHMMAVLAGATLGDTALDPAPADYSPAGTNMIVHRSVFEKIGGFSETHFRHMDYEFGTRANRRGLRLRYDPRVRVWAKVPDAVWHKQYFRRWYFKSGIAAALEPDDPASRSLLLVPRWVWRQMAEYARKWMSEALRTGPDKAFARETRLVHLLGFLAARWHARLRPGSHDQWVARWSQKPGGRFA